MKRHDRDLQARKAVGNASLAWPETLLCEATHSDPPRATKSISLGKIARDARWQTDVHKKRRIQTKIAMATGRRFLVVCPSIAGQWRA
jgi:hypothetical protein